MSGEKKSGMKSAYELALERMEREGIERPREEALSEATKQAIGEARRVTESKLAELEILHRDKLGRLEDWDKRAEQEELYRRDRERILAEGEAKVAQLRRA
jgi:hypothetical protein